MHSAAALQFLDTFPWLRRRHCTFLPDMLYCIRFRTAMLRSRYLTEAEAEILVTFELKEETAEALLYRYYPDGAEDRPGQIRVSRLTGEAVVTELAPDDFSWVVSIDEQNEMRTVANELYRQSGEAELTEEEWPSASSAYISTFYADRAMEEIRTRLREGTVPETGTCTWY